MNHGASILPRGHSYAGLLTPLIWMVITSRLALLLFCVNGFFTTSQISGVIQMCSVLSVGTQPGGSRCLHWHTSPLAVVRLSASACHLRNSRPACCSLPSSSITRHALCQASRLFLNHV